MNPTSEEARRFLMARVEIDANGCWIWQGAKAANGYGRVRFKRDADGSHYSVATHRISYMIHVGPIPDELVLDHLCRVTQCCNPQHLEAVTNRVNTIRGISPAATRARVSNRVDRHLSACELLTPVDPTVDLDEMRRRPPAQRTHCPQGHPYSGANLIISRGARLCRECRRASRREYVAKRRQSRSARPDSWRSSDSEEIQGPLDLDAVEALLVNAEAEHLPAGSHLVELLAAVPAMLQELRDARERHATKSPS